MISTCVTVVFITLYSLDNLLNLQNISGGEDAGFAPSFIEKPKIIPNESGTLITMRCKCTAKPKPVVSWFKGTKAVQESSKIKMKMNENEDTFEILLEIQVPFTLMY